jgi:anti-sigma factor RsiW
MNTDCRDIELELADFAAGDLDPAGAEQVARHVAACAACRAELQREWTLRRTLAGLPAAWAPAGLVPAPAVRPRRRGLALPALVAAALLAALLAVLPDTAPVAPEAAPYSSGQVAAARRDAARSLLLAARILERSERTAVSDVFGARLPRTVAESIRAVAGNPEGGQG